MPDSISGLNTDDEQGSFPAAGGGSSGKPSLVVNGGIHDQVILCFRRLRDLQGPVLLGTPRHGGQGREVRLFRRVELFVQSMESK